MFYISALIKELRDDYVLRDIHEARNIHRGNNARQNNRRLCFHVVSRFIALPCNKPSVSHVILSTALRSVENHVPPYWARDYNETL